MQSINCRNNAYKTLLPIAAAVTGTLALGSLCLGIFALVQHRVPSLKLGSLSTYLLQQPKNAKIIGGALLAASAASTIFTVGSLVALKKVCPSKSPFVRRTDSEERPGLIKNIYHYRYGDLGVVASIKNLDDVIRTQSTTITLMNQDIPNFPSRMHIVFPDALSFNGKDYNLLQERASIGFDEDQMFVNCPMYQDNDNHYYILFPAADNNGSFVLCQIPDSRGGIDS